MNLNFSLTTTDDGSKFITVFVDGHFMPTIGESHPNFEQIKDTCLSYADGDDVYEDDPLEFLDLFDIPATIERKFERLSERVTVVGGEILVDGDPAQPGLSKQILRMMQEGEDFAYLVNFLEKITTNPDDHSRTQAWDWLDNHDFTITTDGDVIGYKGVQSDSNGGYTSVSSGRATRNGEEIIGLIPNAVGDTIEMPRSAVAHSPSEACSTGLHVGTFDYASSWGRNGAMLRVRINPRDIVSVPTDAGGEKIRVCRYVVDDIIDAPETKSVFTITMPSVKWDDFSGTGEDLDHYADDFGL